MRYLLTIALAVSVSACTTGDPLVDVSRAAARSVVRPVVAQYFPGPQAEAVTDCVINNATSTELFALARDISVEPGTATVQTVLTIVQRPQTITCITQNGIAPFLGRI